MEACFLSSELEISLQTIPFRRRGNLKEQQVFRRGGGEGLNYAKVYQNHSCGPSFETEKLYEMRIELLIREKKYRMGMYQKDYYIYCGRM